MSIFVWFSNYNYHSLIYDILMKLQQVNFAYHPQEDRILMRIAGESKDEIRIWLTRKSLKNFLSQAQKWLLHDQENFQNVNEFFKREKAAVDADNSKNFHGGESFPLGKDPLLATSLIIQSDKNSSSIIIEFVENQKMTLNLAEDALAGIQKILCETIVAAEWSLSLEDKNITINSYPQVSITKH